MKIKLAEVQALLETKPSKPEVFYHFKMDWVNVSICLFLLGEVEEAKELIKSSLKNLSFEDCETLVAEAIPLRNSHPEIFKYLIPSKTKFVFILYKQRHLEILEEKVAGMKKNNPEKFIFKINQLNYLPVEMLGNLTISNSNYDLILNDKELNYFYHTFGLSTIKPNIHFNPEVLVHADLIEADDLIPVKVSLVSGEIDIYLNIIKEKKPINHYQFKPSEVIEGILSLDPKNSLKVFSYTDRIKHFFKIAELIKSSPRKNLEQLFVSYFDSNSEVKIKGYQMYQEFMGELSFLPEELKEFNRLVQDLKLQEDKAFFLIYLLRMEKETPSLIKPFLKVNSFYESIIEVFDSTTNNLLK